MLRRTFLKACQLSSSCESIVYNSNIKKDSGIVHLTLNNTKALNALTLPMVQAMLPFYQYLRTEQGKKETPAMILKGEGRAFCSGGDVVSIVKSIGSADPATKHLSQEFFYTEYQVNHALLLSHVPQVAFLNGVVMGGGVGVSVHGSHRLATDKALFAMPETAIGLFPDVGGSWFLPRLKLDGLGLYLAMTGQRLKGADLVYAGIATHFIPEDKLDKVEQALIEGAKEKMSRSDSEDSHNTLQKKCEWVDEVINATVPNHKELLKEKRFSLEEHMPLVSRHFGSMHEDVASVVESLKSDGGKWATETLEILDRVSPLSVKLSFAMHRKGKTYAEPGEVFKLEYRASQHCTTNGDFATGVRSVLIDKSKEKPQWQHQSLNEVKKEDVEKFLEPAPNGVEWSSEEPFPLK